MRTRGKFCAPRVTSRLSTLAASVAMFSLTLAVVGPTPLHKHAGTGTPVNIVDSSHASADESSVHKGNDRADNKWANGWQSSELIPVSFTPSDLPLDRKTSQTPDSVFSHRQMDEFLDHQVRLQDGARDGEDFDDIQIF